MEELRITGTGSELQGVGRLSDGRAVFVPAALPGELVRVKIVRSAQRYCEAELVEVLEPSADRTELSCSMAGQCGGCQARHMRYETSLVLKKQRVYDALSRIGGIQEPHVLDTIGCADPERTRNKAEYPISRDANGRQIIGAYAKDSHRIVPLDDCLLQRAPSAQALRWFSERLPKLKGAEHFKGLVTRVNREGALMLTLCADAPVFAAAEAIAPELCQALPMLKSFYFCKLSGRPSHALDGVCKRIWGDERLEDQLLGLKFSLSPQSFFQINPEQTEVLYRKALEAVGLPGSGAMRILDAYCGAGTITLAAAREAAFATGVEIVSPAIADAKRNAERNGLAKKTRFICGDAAAEIPRMIAAGERFDAAILDPPRKGADEKLLHALIQAAPPRISYVSCNPATLARDVKILAEGGYRLEWAQPVDMFPWTGHVESVVCLSREKADDYVRISVHTKDLKTSMN